MKPKEVLHLDTAKQNLKKFRREQTKPQSLAVSSAGFVQIR